MNSPESPLPEASAARVTLAQLLGTLNQIPAGAGETELQMVELGAGDVLFEQGDAGDSLYVLIAGVLGVRIRHEDGSETEIDRLAPGAVVGEMALMGGQKRSATVYAVNDVGLFRLSRADYEEIVAASPAAATSVGGDFGQRWQRLQLARVFKALLGDLDVASLHTLQAEVQWRHYANGEVVFHQGSAPDGMAVVINGRLRAVATAPDGTETAVTEIAPGEPVGEFALLTDEPRSATVYAVRETNVALITPETFAKLGRADPQFMTRLAQIMVGRQQRALSPVHRSAPAPLSLALVPADPTVDVALFARRLAEALAPYGSCASLDAPGFEAQFGQAGSAQVEAGDPTHAAIVAWLDEFESDHQYLLFVADPQPTAWTRRCLGHVDRVLLLADPQADPRPGPVEQWLAQMEIPLRVELALWHPAGTERPQETQRWLAPREAHLHAHHHVRRGDSAHMARLARRLTGHAVALVLSGGAARGYAHLGVHRALEELGIPIDYVGATSMGAVMGAAMVTLGSNERMMALSKQHARPQALFDRTLPLTSIMASKKVTRFTRELFGEARIEDQWIPFFCVASNLTTAEPVIYRRGPIWRAVRASLSIPGVFAPVMEAGDTIVDGGVMDNFPAGLTAGFSESRRIIGVNVAPFKDKKRQYDFDTDISGWRILFSRINPFRRSLRAPSLVGVLLRTQEINSVRRAREEEAFVDVMIYPDVKDIGLQSYHRFEEIARRGYDAALESLRAWWAQAGMH